MRVKARPDLVELFRGGLTIREASAASGVPRSTLHRWIKAEQRRRAPRLPNVYGISCRTGRSCSHRGERLPMGGRVGDRPIPSVIYPDASPVQIRRPDGSTEVRPSYLKREVASVIKQGRERPRALTEEEAALADRNRARANADLRKAEDWFEGVTRKTDPDDAVAAGERRRPTRTNRWREPASGQLWESLADEPASW